MNHIFFLLGSHFINLHYPLVFQRFGRAGPQDLLITSSLSFAPLAGTVQAKTFAAWMAKVLLRPFLPAPAPHAEPVGWPRQKHIERFHDSCVKRDETMTLTLAVTLISSRIV